MYKGKRGRKVKRYTIRDFKYDSSNCPMAKLQGLENDIEDEKLVYESKAAVEILTTIEELLEKCTEDEYSEPYGPSPKKWFNIGLFRRKFAKLKKKYIKKYDLAPVLQ